MRLDRKEYERDYYRKNRERILARNKTHYQNNRERILAQGKVYAAANADKVHTRQAAWQKRNRERCLEKCRRWYRNHLLEQRLRGRLKARQTYVTNREAILAANREWSHRNTDKIRSRDLRRRALIKGAEVNLDHMMQWMASVKRKHFIRCYWCASRVKTSEIHFDHIVPLSKGGAHAVSNLCVSCAHCNCSKQAKSVSAWVRIGQQTLSL